MVGGGFINWANSWRERMGRSRWCDAYSMCPKQARGFFMTEGTAFTVT